MSRARGRPLGEFAQAVLGAVVRLETVDSAPTAQEIKAHLHSKHLRMINDRELRSTIESLKLCDKLEIKRYRKVSYCTKPVSELGLAVVDAPQNINQWYSAMSVWMGAR